MAKSLKNFNSAFDLLYSITTDACSFNWRGESKVKFEDLCPSILSPYMTYDRFKKRVERLNTELPYFALYQGLNLFLYLIFVPVTCTIFFVWAASGDKPDRVRTFDLVCGVVFLLTSISWIIQTKTSNQRFSKALNLMLAEFNAEDESLGVCWTSRARLNRWDYRLMGIKTPPIDVVTIIILRPIVSTSAPTSPQPAYAALPTPQGATTGEPSQPDAFQAIPMEAIAASRPATPSPMGRAEADLEAGYDESLAGTTSSAGAFVTNVNVARKSQSPVGVSAPPPGGRWTRLE
ncbi:hypothetical protein M427DRAFT_38675 [Gonapodya prolifera JEL478]|uniref:Uncharacterized protein n=1 Tax=Gonapodya prolifera (strain JEL478) TaxID=1344416 RepID=A0A138ZYP0_GONPJ|nr:hypothetical protein M427DRAFT_38675 [Gonapodya prolifera JEL478]|eukprot:KXS09626.1 hypothetical protein M427DRAFT_38675 [Gonapodya prolifera JEL478]